MATDSSHEFTGAITIGVTGASGAPYTLELLRQLVAANQKIFLIFSSAAKVVFKTEVGHHSVIPGNTYGGRL